MFLASDPVWHYAASGFLEMNSRMSSTLQTVIRGPSFNGRGYSPDLTPAHHVLFDTGMIAGIGGSALGAPRILGSRRKPVSGNVTPIVIASAYVV